MCVEYINEVFKASELKNFELWTSYEEIFIERKFTILSSYMKYVI